MNRPNPRLRSLGVLRGPVLRGPARPAPDPWRALALVASLVALALAVRIASGATGPGSTCDFDGECPPALTCKAGRCAPGAAR